MRGGSYMSNFIFVVYHFMTEEWRNPEEPSPINHSTHKQKDTHNLTESNLSHRNSCLVQGYV